MIVWMVLALIPILDAPTVTPANSSTHVLILRQSIRLLCYYTGVPAPSLQWYLNGTNIGRSRPGDGRNFTMNDVYMYDGAQQGTYTCRVTNSLGYDEASYSVRLGICLSAILNFLEVEHSYMSVLI